MSVSNIYFVKIETLFLIMIKLMQDTSMSVRKSIGDPSLLFDLLKEDSHHQEENNITIKLFLPTCTPTLFIRKIFTLDKTLFFGYSLFANIHTITKSYFLKKFFAFDQWIIPLLRGIFHILFEDDHLFSVGVLTFFLLLFFIFVSTYYLYMFMGNRRYFDTVLPA